ncbi:MAG: ABC transporter ATP-binding protein [Bdellovibrionota bacterium]
MVSDHSISLSASKSNQFAYSLDIVNLSKSFRRNTQGGTSYTTLKSMLLGMFKRSEPKKVKYTHAVKDLTLRIPRGSSVGIIGRNGSGKSTLLKLISGIYKADQGSVSVNGRISALIELGAGFHPDFTGRENLYLGGIMHGLTRKEIDQRFETIVKFAELEEVIDDPVRTYSSGMYMRLGFSLAVHTDPDILIVDEVLAVGDAAFVSKCHDKIGELRKAGKTLFLVTHDLTSVERWGDEVLWLNAGAVVERGEPRRVIDEYRQFLENEEETKIFDAEADELQSQESDKVLPERWGSREIEIKNVRLLGAGAAEHRVFNPEDAVTVEIEYFVHEPRSEIVFGISINRNDGTVIHGSNTDIERIELPELGSSGLICYKIKRLSLLEGAYSIDTAVHRDDGYPYDYHKAAVSFVVRSARSQVGVFEPEHSWEVLPSQTRSSLTQVK